MMLPYALTFSLRFSFAAFSFAIRLYAGSRQRCRAFSAPLLRAIIAAYAIDDIDAALFSGAVFFIRLRRAPHIAALLSRAAAVATPPCHAIDTLMLPAICCHCLLLIDAASADTPCFADVAASPPSSAFRRRYFRHAMITPSRCLSAIADAADYAAITLLIYVMSLMITLRYGATTGILICR